MAKKPAAPVVPVEAAPVELERPWLCQITNCPTPLTKNPATVVAAGQAAAKAKFFELNGISATSHEVRIEPANAN